MNGWLDEIDLQTINKFFYCPELLFLFLKGMAGTLVPFSYLLLNRSRVAPYLSIADLKRTDHFDDNAPKPSKWYFFRVRTKKQRRRKKT
jgi:hypothetical protein